MHRPAAYEFGALQRKRLWPIAACLVFAARPEGDHAIVVRDQPPVRDGAAGHVRRQVFQHVRRLAPAVGRPFHENVPIGSTEFVEPHFPLRRILQRLPLALQPQLATAYQSPEAVDEVLAKALSQLGVVYQERFPATRLSRVAAVDPLLAVERRPPAGNQGVNVRMVAQPLVPSVQHELCRGLELARAPQGLVQGSPRSLEQQIVQSLTIAENQAGQLVRQGEDHLEVVDFGQYQLLGLLQPIRAPSPTALRAVAIDARIVNVALIVARRTFVQAAFQRRGTAEQDA